MDIITSRHNRLIKHVVSLHESSARSTHRQFIAEGLRTCSTLSHSSITMNQLFYTTPNKHHIDQFASAEYIPVTDEVMLKMTTTSTPSGILGIFEIPAEPTLDMLTPGIVLAQIANPGNMGTLIRTAAALSISSVVVVEGCDPWSPKVVQATAGTIGTVRIFDIGWDVLVQEKKEIPLCALVVEGGLSLQSTNIQNSLLVVGSEVQGINPAWLSDCATHVTLPMPGGTESLNAAIAGSIALYMGYMK